MKHDCLSSNAWTVRAGVVVCVDCVRRRQDVFDERDSLRRAMRNLASSLRWAGALQAMFDQGHRRGYWESPGDSILDDEDWKHIELNTWSPNTAGREVPGRGSR